MPRLIGDDYDFADQCAGCVRAIQAIVGEWGQQLANDTPISGADFLQSVAEILHCHVPFALPDPGPEEEEDQ